MDSRGYLAATSIALGAFLGAMSQFIFYLPALISCGIAISSVIGLFMVMLVMNSIGFQRSSHNDMEE